MLPQHINMSSGLRLLPSPSMMHKQLYILGIAFVVSWVLHFISDSPLLPTTLTSTLRRVTDIIHVVADVYAFLLLCRHMLGHDLVMPAHGSSTLLPEAVSSLGVPGASTPNTPSLAAVHALRGSGYSGGGSSNSIPGPVLSSSRSSSRRNSSHHGDVSTRRRHSNRSSGSGHS
jgi:hypothetical protein